MLVSFQFRTCLFFFWWPFQKRGGVSAFPGFRIPEVGVTSPKRRKVDGGVSPSCYSLQIIEDNIFNNETVYRLEVTRLQFSLPL